MTFARQPRPAAFLSLLFTLVLHFLLDGALARPAILANDGTLVPVPNEDPFYTPPAGFEDLPPGSIIRSRPLPGHITLDNATPLHPEAAWQILYRSQDSVGVPEATVVTIIKPYNADPTKLMAFGFFSEAAFNACNPSVAIQVGAREDAAYTQQQNMIIVTGLNRGWYVSVADDTGPKSSFGAPLHSGYSTLDSLRAVSASGNITGVAEDLNIVMYGYSAGAITIAMATELQPLYAPELDINGAAVGGVAPNQTHLMKTFNKNDRTSFVSPVVMGLAHDYQNFTEWLDENLVPELAADFKRSEHQCFDSNWNWTDNDMGPYFKNGYDSLFQDEVPRSVLYWGAQLGIRSTPTVPWYMFNAAQDDATPIMYTDQLYEKHCKNGAKILFERNPFPVDHRLESLWGTAGSFEWMEDRLKNIPLDYTCVKYDVSPHTLKAAAMGTLIKGFVDLMLESYLGVVITGPR